MKLPSPSQNLECAKSPF
nr:unnamed protein product [Callosobruchus analis]